MQRIPGDDVAAQLASFVQLRVGARHRGRDGGAFGIQHRDVDRAEKCAEVIGVGLAVERNREHTNSSCAGPLDPFPRSWFTALIHRHSYDFHSFGPITGDELERRDCADDDNRRRLEVRCSRCDRAQGGDDDL
jgi:hypothetical protein